MQLSSVDLNVLVALDALLAERSVTRAARRVGLSQPGMSNALARLRRMFDDPLLVREGAASVLTPRAETLVHPVREALALLQHALDERLGFDPSTDPCTYRISCSDYSVLMLIGPLVRTLRRRAPYVRIEVLPRALDPVGLLRNGRADLVIEPTAVMAGAALPHQPLFEDSWLCCVWAGSERVGNAVTEAQYLELGHVVYSMGAGHPVSLADVHLGRLGAARQVDVTVESFLLAPYVLQGTDLMTVVPARAASHLSRTAELRFLAPPVAVPPFVEAQWWHPRNTADPAHAWVRSQLAGIAHEVAGGSAPAG
ncbi:LysR family transcriptional regulator [Modestobacter lapidis]|nr:LysR family transcriptional regulator [Modestobacter lapidis]